MPRSGTSLAVSAPQASSCRRDDMRFKSVIAERRFLILFIAILFDWLVYPLLESTTMAKTLLGSFSLAILLSALFASGVQVRVGVLGGSILAAAIGASVLKAAQRAQ
jgi:hypothetical protein